MKIKDITFQKFISEEEILTKVQQLANPVARADVLHDVYKEKWEQLLLLVFVPATAPPGSHVYHLCLLQNGGYRGG